MINLNGEIKITKQIEKELIIAINNKSPSHSELNNLLEQYQNGRYGNTEKLALSITQRFPEHQFAWKVLGAVIKQTGRVSESLLASQKSVQLDPLDPEAYNNLSVTLIELGRLDEAEASLKQAIALNPDYAEAYNNLGVTFKELGKLEDSIDSYKKALSIIPEYAEAHYNLAITLKKLSRFEEAEASLRQAISLKSNYAEAYNNLGNILQELGKLDEAVARLITAIELKPDYVEAWTNIYFPLNIIKSLESYSKDYLTLIFNKKIFQLNDVRLSVLKYKLNIGGEYSKFFFDKAVDLLSANENIKIQNPEPLKNNLNRNKILPEKVISLLHFGRSGTGLLHSLIDNHSEISTLPSIYFSEFFDGSTWEKITADGWVGMVDRFIRSYPVLFDSRALYPVPTTNMKSIASLGVKEGMATLGKNRNEFLYLNKAFFRKELTCLMAEHDYLDPLVFFKLVHVAYEKALGNDDKKTTIFYHIHNPDIHAKLNFIKSTPNSKWIMMVREPLQNCESWISRHFIDNSYSKISTRITTMLFDVDNISFRDKDFVGLRLEDLKENPGATIPALCKWMGINEEQCLYEMTAQGKRWWGDPSSPNYLKEGMLPFGKPAAEYKIGKIFSRNDHFILRTLFYPFSVSFGYVEEDLEQFKNDLLKIRPMMEQMFDFEKEFAQRTKVNPEQFMKSGSYLYLRTKLIERWQVLNEFHTYPNMLKPLKIK